MKSQAFGTLTQKEEISLTKAKNFNISTPQSSPLPPKEPASRLKILVIITQGVWGGAQRYVLDLATEMAKKHEVTVAIGEVCGATDLQEKLKTHPEIKLIQLKHLQRAINPYHDILALFELKKLYNQVQPDIIQLNSTKAGILGSFAKSLFAPKATKLIYTVHGWIFLEPLAPLTKSLFRFLEKLTAPSKDAFIVLSPEEKQIAHEQLHLPEAKLHIIPLGINPNTPLAPEQAKQKLQTYTTQIITHKKLIGNIAGLYQTKGLDILVNSIAQNKKLQDNTHYFIIGEGPERTTLEELIKTNNLQNTITLTGHIDNAAELIPGFDLFVLPSKKEGLPYVLLEAMQCNIPIVATSVGGVESLLSTYPIATTIPPLNQEKLHRAILSALSQSGHNLYLPHINSLQNMITSTLALYWSLISEE